MCIVQVLCIHWDVPLVSVGEIEEACLIKYDPATKVTATFPRRSRYNQFLLVNCLIAFQFES